MKTVCSGVGADCRKGKGFCKGNTGRRDEGGGRDEVASVSGASTRQVCAGSEARRLGAQDQLTGPGAGERRSWGGWSLKQALTLRSWGHN